MIASSRTFSRSQRRGSTLTGFLTILAVLGGFALIAVAVRPLSVGAAAQSGPRLAARTVENQQVVDSLAAIIGSSAEVIAVHPRGRGELGGVDRRSAQAALGSSPFVEIVLRLQNDRNSEFISHGEIAVISHSEVLETITFTAVRPRSASAEPGMQGASQAEIELFTRSEVAAPRFCNDWRRREDVDSRVLATGVSDFRAELLRQSGVGGEGRSRLALHLIWSGNGLNKPADEAAIIVDVREVRR